MKQLLQYNNKGIHTKKGYVALLLIIIIIPVLVMGGIELLYSNIDTLKAAKNLSDAEKLNFDLRSCTEEAIKRVKTNLTFTGQIDFSINTTICSVTVSNDTNPSIKILNTKTNSENLYKSEIKKLDTSKSPYELTN